MRTLYTLYSSGMIDRVDGHFDNATVLPVYQPPCVRARAFFDDRRVLLDHDEQTLDDLVRLLDGCAEWWQAPPLARERARC